MLFKPKETIIGVLYRAQLMKLSQQLRKKYAYNYSIHSKIPLNDKVGPCGATLVKTFLETFNWKVLPQPAYSPDIAPRAAVGVTSIRTF